MVSSEGAVAAVVGFCRLQRRLVEHFLREFQPKDLEWFSDVSEKGLLEVDGRVWRYGIHGAGVSFAADGIIVDAHVGLAAYPDGIDGWRLLQFLESTGVEELVFDGERASADDEPALERVLAKLASAGILEEVALREPARRLFRPSRGGLPTTSA